MTKITNTSTVTLINHMGSDLTVVNAARVSMNKESTWDEANGCLNAADARLVAYLNKHDHWTPFGHVMFQFRISCPIFVARQWFRHTIGVARNEVSRRYVDEPVEFYLPDTLRARPDASIKQGSGGIHAKSDDWLETIELFYNSADDLYNDMIADGVAPEQARMILPLAHMTEFYETASLAFYMRAGKLRLDSHAQGEIQDLMKLLAEQIEPIAGVSWEAAGL